MTVMIGNLLYTIKQAIQQAVRNRAMSFASIFSITAMLLILGIFFIGVVNLNVAISKAQEDYEEVQVYLLDETTYDRGQEILNDLESTGLLSEAKYLSKEEGLQEWKAEWGENAGLLDSLPSNPLPNALVLRVNHLEDAKVIAEKAGRAEGVESVRFYQETVEKLMKVVNWLQMAAWVAMVFLVIISTIVVSNTIKLTVFARSREITMMKYIGATNWFIRGPFLVEGMLIGLFSALISLGASGLIYSKLISLIGVDISMMFQMELVPLGFLVTNLLWIFISIGISIGAVGSIISMRRFLDT